MGLRSFYSYFQPLQIPDPDVGLKAQKQQSRATLSAASIIGSRGVIRAAAAGAVHASQASQRHTGGQEA